MARTMNRVLILSTIVCFAAPGAADNVCGIVDPMDFSGIPILPFGGEYLGLGPSGGEIVGATIDVTFTTQGEFDAANLGVSLVLVHVNGGAGAGFTGQQLDWAGQGTFTAHMKTDNLNGVILTNGAPHSGWLLFFSNLDIAAGPIQGTFDKLIFNLEYAPCPQGDVNMDIDVDVEDLLMVVGSWGTCSDPPASCPADMDHNGVVDVIDLLVVIGHWGQYCPDCQ